TLAADPVLIIEFVDFPKIIPGPPAAKIVASEGKDLISWDLISCATIHRPTPSSSITARKNSHPSYFVTRPTTSYRRTYSSNPYNNCCHDQAHAYAVLWC